MADIHLLARTTDTALAANWDAQSELRRRLGSIVTSLRREAGQRCDRHGVWSGSLEDALAFVPPARWAAERRRDLLEERQHLLGRLRDLESEASDLDAVWRANGHWSRFFLVTSSDGHIHASMGCSTCFASTRFAWLPELSGLGESEAVEAYGPVLCSVCFPSAPVEWTNGPSKASLEAKERRAQQQQARQRARLEKALLPDGSALEVERYASGGSRERIVTLYAARQFLTDSFQSPALFDEASVQLVARAVCAKTGEPVDAVLDAARRRAARRR